MDIKVNEAEALSVSPDLVGPPPRSVELTGSGLALAVFTAAVIVAAVIHACFVGMEATRQIQIRTALRGGAKETVGQIQQLRDRYHPLKEYVDYTFLADGKTSTGEAIVPLEDWHILQSARAIPVRYLPGNPAINHPADWEWSAISEWDAYDVPLFVAAFLFAFFIPGRMYFERKLAAEGVATAGVVTKCSVSGRSGNFIRLRYEFRTEDGLSVQGSGSFRTRQEIGAKVLVLYLAQEPKKNVPYPLSAWRIAMR